MVPTLHYKCIKNAKTSYFLLLYTLDANSIALSSPILPLCLTLYIVFGLLSHIVKDKLTPNLRLGGNFPQDRLFWYCLSSGTGKMGGVGGV